MKCKNLKLSIGSQRLIQLELVEGYNLDELGSLADCEIRVDIKKWRNKRSLTANAYMWVLLQKMAEVMHTSKDELYLLMLQRYGQFTHIIVHPKAVEAFKKEWRTVVELGEVTVNQKKGVQLQCYFGSSGYDTKEMSVLLNGVVDEAKALGIETEPQEEINRLLEMIK